MKTTEVQDNDVTSLKENVKTTLKSRNATNTTNTTNNKRRPRLGMNPRLTPKQVLF